MILSIYIRMEFYDWVVAVQHHADEINAQMHTAIFKSVRWWLCGVCSEEERWIFDRVGWTEAGALRVLVCKCECERVAHECTTYEHAYVQLFMIARY